MRILIISQYFWPETFRINDLCSELVQRNHHVTVLTGKPNYPGGDVFPEFESDPSKYGQYKGARVVRVPMLARGQGNSLRLLMNYLSFAFSASLWGWIKLRKLEFDIIFVFQASPVTVGLPAIFLKKIKKIPVVLWVLDLWPETLEALGVIKSKFILGLIGRMVSLIYNGCDLVLGQSRAFLDGIALHCREREKIKYFPSWSEDIFSSQVSGETEEIAKFNGAFKVLFAGNVGEAQDFPSLIKAAEHLKSENACVKFFIVGDGRMLSWVKQQVVEKGLENYIYLLGRHPLEEMPVFYASADALLVCLKKSKVFSMTIPGKLQTYMMAGKPILAMLDGEGARVVNEANAGHSCNAEDFRVLADNVVAMSNLKEVELEVLGNNARNYAHREFEREVLISQLEQWLSELVFSNPERVVAK